MQEKFWDWHAFDKLDLECAWTVEWHLLCEGERVVRFKLADVLVSALHAEGAAAKLFWSATKGSSRASIEPGAHGSGAHGSDSSSSESSSSTSSDSSGSGPDGSSSSDAADIDEAPRCIALVPTPPLL